MARRFTKAHIETHNAHMYGPGLPAVNVKVWFDDNAVDWADIASEFGWDADELDRFRDWLDTETDNYGALDWAWEAACEDGWEMARDDAREMFGDGIQVWGAGRCGGWLVVDGLKGYRSRYDECNDGIDSWDAIDVARWGKFVRWVEAIRDDTSHRFVWLIAANVWEAEKEATELTAADAVL